MTKAALYKPMIHFERGWWRVARADVSWKYLRQADRERITKAHEHIFKLNNTDEAEAMRDAYYGRIAAEKKANRRRMQEAFEVSAVPHPDGPVTLAMLLDGR